MSDFFRTALGVQFVQHTVPDLVQKVAALAKAIEHLADATPGRAPDDLVAATRALIAALRAGCSGDVGATPDLAALIDAADRAANAAR